MKSKSAGKLFCVGLYSSFTLKMNEDCSRSIADINEMLNLAKLSESDITPTSQSLYFTNEKLYTHNYKLLELDQYLQEQIQEGQTLYIKGDDDENVVLCTERKTYDVVEAETSNSLLLVNDLNFFADLKNESNRNSRKISVHGVFYEYLSVTSSKPHLRKLKVLLEKTTYKGQEHEFNVKPEDLYTLADLCNRIQASDVELKEALNNLDIVTIDNKIRLLDIEYHFRILSLMLKLIEENSWPLDEIDYDETVNCLKDLVPEEILRSLLDKWTEESKIIDGLQLYSYKEEKVCTFFAQILLYSAGKFNFEDFLQAWAEAVPEGMCPDENFLHGIAIINRQSNPRVIKAFPEENLPEDINARLEVLFKEKNKWTVSEITPYIKRLTTPKMDVNALLAKFARASNVQGVKYYSAKHGK